MSHNIQHGDQVIIKTAKGLKGVQARKDRTIRLDKYSVCLDDIIGHPFGSVFEKRQKKLIKIDPEVADIDQGDLDTERDNRNLKDDAENQKLKKEDLQALKRKGLTGSDIVDHLVENSTTFNQKTEFSQAKYIKKKIKKWEFRFTVLRPTTRLIAEMYFAKGPSRICNLREDSLAQLLTLSNIRANSNVMVCESMAGVVVGAILERLGGLGNLVQFYNGPAPSREALEYFAFSEQLKKPLKRYPLANVSSLGTDIPIKVYSSNDDFTLLEPPEKAAVNTEESTQDSVEEESEVKSEEEELTSPPSEEAQMETSEDKPTNAESSTHSHISNRKRKQPKSKEERVIKRNRWVEELKATKAFLEERNMDALILASKDHPSPILLALINFLAPSRPFVVHCMYKEPLVDLFGQLREKGGVVNLQLTETWLRNYQVLPGRTHPLIKMAGTGGYILTGITVLKS